MSNVFRAFVYNTNGETFYGTITRDEAEDECYQFEFEGGFEAIRLFKVKNEWVYAGGMRVPNVRWIAQLGEQIDQRPKLNAISNTETADSNMI